MPPRARKGTKRAPKKPPRAPKTSPREPQNTIKSIFRSQTLIFHKSSSRRSEIKVFEGGRDSLGAQNRQEEAPREGKQRLERRWRKNKRTKTYTYGNDKVQQRSFLFHRFAHSAGPGIVRQRVEWIGSGVDGLMQSSKWQVRSAL